MRRLSGARIAALVIAALVPVAYLVPAAAAPRVSAFPAAIEGYAAYQGQTTCSATAKPGVARFRDLVLKTYPNTRNLGIVRGCNVGGRSEHKEGRAWDWGVRADRPAEAAAVNDLLKWVFATDSAGRKHAVARRLGLQYVIWNRKIWGSYSASSGWRPYTGASPHTDHVHFSFGRPGAEARTSFFSGRVAAVAAAPQAETIHPEVGDGDTKSPVSTEPQPPAHLAQSGSEILDEVVRINVRDPRGTNSRGAMKAGEKYLLEVWGKYNWGGGLADTECSVAKGSDNWVRDRSLDRRQRRADHLDLYVNGQDLFAKSDDGSRCDTRTHVYRWMYEAERTGKANFQLWDTKHTDNSGLLSVRIIKVREVADQTVRVDARNWTGQTSSGSLRKGTEYVVTATGHYAYGGGWADAECSSDATGTEWKRDRSVSRSDEDADHLDLYVSGHDMLAKPVVDTGDQCDTRSHTYVWRMKADTTGPVNVRVWDLNYGDNRGALTVRFTRADQYVAPRTQSAPVVQPSGSPTAAPSSGTVTAASPTAVPSKSAAPKPTPTPAVPSPSAAATLPPATGTETLLVDAASAAGATTTRSYTAGVQYVLEAVGTYWWGKGEADAECVRLQQESRWRRSNSSWTMPGTGVALFDVTVNGQVLDWQAVRGGDCDTDGHRYRMTFVPQQTGPIVLAVLDSYHADNRGVIRVTLGRA